MEQGFGELPYFVGLRTERDLLLMEPLHQTQSWMGVRQAADQMRELQVLMLEL